MRRLFFAIMIVLLPMRAWAGDAMAMRMVIPPSTQNFAAAASEPLESAYGSAMLVNATAVAPPTAAADCSVDGKLAAADGSHCPTCSVCQSCHTLAVLMPAVVMGATVIGTNAAHVATPRVASAVLALELKPPIS